MARIRTQKVVARRIDLSYFKRVHPLRTGRKLLAFAAGLIAILAVTFLSLGDPARMHNPGRLTASHAAWEHDCRACHDGGGPGTGPSPGYSKSVSDAACLKCHDGGLHNINQPDATLASWPGIAGTGEKAHFTAKDCVSCHTEHRGHEALVATDNRLCISCHTDITQHSQQTPAIKNRIVAFTAESHPPFGRKLMQDGKIIDPTVLKFNHAKHNGFAVLTDNCVACHSPLDAPVATHAPSATVAPPYTTPDVRPASWAKTDARAYMAPISYERNCIGCHALELPGKVRLTIPHESLATVRGFLGGIGNEYATALQLMPDKSKELKTEVVTGRPPRVTRKTVILTEQEWVAARMKELGESVDKSFGSDAAYAGLKKVLPPPSTQPSTQPGLPVGPNVNLLEQFVTYGIGSNCAFCHEVKGTVPAIAFAPSTQPAAAPAMIASIVPTGVGTAPRKWFAASHFDHNAHRAESCRDCHADAWTSSATSDFLSPNINTGAASCVSCHKDDTRSLVTGNIRGASATCTTCHSFHDPLLERPSTGSFDAKTGMHIPRVANDPNATPAPAATRTVSDAR